jgi:hypothetical protein
MRKISLLASLLLLCYSNIFAQTQTVGLFTYLTGSYDDGYVLFPPYTGCDTTYLINRCGKLIHKWPSAYTPGADAYLLPDGSILRAGHYPNTIFDSCTCGTGGIIERIDWSGKVVWHYIISSSSQVQSHDIYPMPNGNILVNVWENMSVSQAVAAGRNPGMLGPRLYSPKIMEIKPIGTDSAQIVWTWRLWDHLVQDYSSARANYGVVTNHPELVNINYVDWTAGPPTVPDWIHLNSVCYNPDLDQVMISAHNFSEIWILDHSTTTATATGHTGGRYHKGGDLLYRWGNPVAYNRGGTKDKKLFQQHDPEWIPFGNYKGQIILFNNGGGRPAGMIGTSVDIISPPMDSSGYYTAPAADSAYGPRSVSWTYPSVISPTFYSATMGSVQVLSNGNLLIDNADAGNFFEIDSTGNTVWMYVNPVSNGSAVTQYGSASFNSVYRCMFYPTSYLASSGLKLVAGDPIEKNPLPTSCTVPVDTSTFVPALNRPQLSVYPNPSADRITIEIDGASAITEMTITDMAGKVLLQLQNSAHKQQIDIADLAKGIYLLRAVDEDGTTIQTKFVKL